MSDSLLTPDWPAPNNIKAFSSTRLDGSSSMPYGSFNLGGHVGDNQIHVQQNRQQLIEKGGLPEPARWLNQVHGTSVITSMQWQPLIEADGMVSTSSNHVCAVMTADCLPILLCNQQGDMVAAVHAGWRGLAAGIIKQAISHFTCHPNELLAWLGPAIGPSQFEVGADVFQAFYHSMPESHSAFQQTEPEHYLADIYQLACQQLNHLGITNVTGGNFCTASDPHHFFSYRRDGVTGRMASVIWIEPK